MPPAPAVDQELQVGSPRRASSSDERRRGSLVDESTLAPARPRKRSLRRRCSTSRLPVRFEHLVVLLPPSGAGKISWTQLRHVNRICPSEKGVGRYVGQVRRPARAMRKSLTDLCAEKTTSAPTQPTAPCRHSLRGANRRSALVAEIGAPRPSTECGARREPTNKSAMVAPIGGHRNNTTQQVFNNASAK